MTTAAVLGATSLFFFFFFLILLATSLGLIGCSVTLLIPFVMGRFGTAELADAFFALFFLATAVQLFAGVVAGRRTSVSVLVAKAVGATVTSCEALIEEYLFYPSSMFLPFYNYLPTSC